MSESNTKAEKYTIRVSVRSLVEFILRSGDIDEGRGGWADRDAMLAGARIHRKIQKMRGTGYRAEVPLRYEKDCGDFLLVIEGRADGIRGDEIEEIKGIYADPEKMAEPVPVHLAQAKCYAYIYGHQENLHKTGVRMTYVNLETERERDFVAEYSVNELDLWFSDLVDSYRKWALFRVSWLGTRDDSMKDLEFPFSYRGGQKKLTADVYRTILRRKQLFADAPTGVGKTMAVVYPSVSALGEGIAVRLFYLTARTITRTVAEDALGVLRSRGLRLKSLTLTAKEKICVLEEAECRPDVCPRAKGHFDRVNDALYEMITEQDDFSREAVLAQAEKWKVCPHELQLDLADFADAVICDYNYVFDPDARLKRFFGETAGKDDYVFLVDEAHNLVDRGRDMFSADLGRSEFLEAARTVRKLKKKGKEGEPGKDSFLTEKLKKLQKAIASPSAHLLRMKKECSGDGETVFPEPLTGRLMNLTGALEDVLSELSGEGTAEERKGLLDFYFRVTEFLNIADLYDDHYMTVQTASADDYNIRLFCVDPSANLQKCLDRGRSTIFFSATLLPIRYYRKLLSGRKDDYAVYVPSSFPPENRLVVIARDVSSLYRRRTPAEFDRIAEYILRVTAVKKGNYMAFFPSYAFMEEVYDAFCQKKSSVPGDEGSDAVCVCQTREMKESDREDFLEKFREDNDRTLIGFCVMGGIFSEGIDLAGERLIGAFVVGTGIPQVGTERELLKKYYSRNGEDGFDFAYRYPGMNKVLQAAGRVIRTMNDRGIVLLMDERFTYREYRAMFPPDWNYVPSVTVDSVADVVETFWQT